jgi:hypothetical protein
MLTYFRFLLLPWPEKIKYVRDNGTLLLDQSQQSYRVELYAVHDYFVEMHHQEPDNQVCDVVAFKTLSRLQHFTQYISLQELLGC